MKEEQSNDSKDLNEKKSRRRKQLISGGLYIALAATVVAITTKGVTTILQGGEGYDAPDFDIDSTLYSNGDHKLNLPEIPDPDNLLDFHDDTQVSDVTPGVDATVKPDTTPAQPDAPVEPTIPDGSEQPPDQKPEEQGDRVPLEGTDLETGEPVDGVSEPTGEDLPTSGEPEYPTEPDGGYSNSTFIKPADGYISREFSPDELLYSPTMYDYRTHSGIDIACDIGSNVKAFSAGVVSDIYRDELYGVTIKIDHTDGVSSYYSNLSESIPQNITVGTAVNAGDVIGGVGESALCEIAEVPHLHFEVRADGLVKDPAAYFRSSEF